MAFVTDYTFYGMSRIGNDNCQLDQNSIQNSQACSYTLQNYFASDCNMTKAKQLAVSQPCVNYSGGYGLAANGCNVDDNSKLMIGGLQTHPKSRVDLFSRPFATVPYLGRGSVDPMLETQIQQGESITNKRTVTNLTEKSYLTHHTTPLIPEMKQKIQNPSLMIEGVAQDGWVRGGVASREIYRDNEQYAKR